ncbi:unnamed protein product, partial [Rangifer tarandus platyrhynchus]
AWGISVLNPNRTKAQGSCEGPHSHLLLSFPYGQLSFGFKQDPPQSAVYLNFMAVEYNVSFPQAVQWTFSVQNSSLRDLQTPLGQSFSCRNASIIVSPALHLDLLSLKLQAAQLSPSGAFGPSPLETPRVQEVESYTAHTQRHFGDSRPFSLNFEQCSKLEEDKMAPSRWTGERKLFPFLSEWMTGLPGLTGPKDHSTYRTTQIPTWKGLFPDPMKLLVYRMGVLLLTPGRDIKEGRQRLVCLFEGHCLSVFLLTLVRV